MVATLPVAVAEVSAAQVTATLCPALSLVASASAKFADTCIEVRSANWMNPEPDEAPAPPPAPLAPPPAPLAPPPEPDEEDPDEDPPTLPVTAVTVPSIGAVSVVPARFREASSTAAWAVVTWAWAWAIVASSPLFLARVKLALAAVRLAW